MMNKRNFIKNLAGLSTLISAPAIANQVVESQSDKPGIGYNDHFVSMFTRDPIWFTIYGTVFEIHQHHRTWHKATCQELEAANISISGTLAKKVGSKFEEGKCIAGFKRNHIGTTAKQFIEVGTEPCTQGVRGFLYRVQAPIEDRGMVEIQSVYVTSQNPEQMIKETPLVVASIGYDKYLLSCDNSEYQLYQWKRYQGSSYFKVTSTVRGLT